MKNYLVITNQMRLTATTFTCKRESRIPGAVQNIMREFCQQFFFLTVGYQKKDLHM